MVNRQSFVTTQTASEMSLLGGSLTNTFSSQSSQESNAITLVPVLGLQGRVVSKLWLGAALAATAPYSHGTIDFSTESTSRVDSSTRSDASSLHGAFDIAPPVRLNLGAAWEDRQRFSAALDVHYYAGQDAATSTRGVQHFTEFRSGDVPRRYEALHDFAVAYDPVVDLSVGVELAVSQLVALRGGVFTDAAQSKPLGHSAKDDARRLRVNRAGGTLGFGLLFGSFESTFGLTYTRGTGTFGAFDSTRDDRVEPIATTEDTLMVLLSGAVTTEEAKAKIRETVPFDVPRVGDRDALDVIGGPASSAPSAPPPAPAPIPAPSPPPAAAAPPAPPPPLPPPPPPEAPPDVAPVPPGAEEVAP